MRLTAAFTPPTRAFRPFADEPWAALLASDGSPGAERSWMLRHPARTLVLRADDGADARTVIAGFLAEAQGTVLGLGAYELGGRFEGLALRRDPDWPDLILADYPSWLEFDHAAEQVSGMGADPGFALSWLEDAEPPAPGAALSAAAFSPEGGGDAAYEAAVAEVVRRIGDGELFQANAAQAWCGRLGPRDTPGDVFERLTAFSPAPLAACWRLPGRALVSHSPERFVRLRDGRVLASPVKGTRPRGATPEEDERLRAELRASAKDRAENLMIVDLMRNDLSRVCRPGTVTVPGLFETRAYPSVWHLVSSVEGELEPGLGPAEVMAAAFPPGSITGAPKHRAMQVIAELEAAPRGPWCGTLMRIRGAEMDSSVLIRTIAFIRDDGGWRWRTLAGAGVTAGSDPVEERLETHHKIAALRQALTGAAPS